MEKVAPRQPLHNFGPLKWGVQSTLRCVKPSNNTASAAGTSQPPPRPKVSFKLRPPDEADCGKDIAEVREKLMHDLKNANDKMKDELIKKNFGSCGSNVETPPCTRGRFSRRKIERGKRNGEEVERRKLYVELSLSEIQHDMFIMNDRKRKLKPIHNMPKHFKKELPRLFPGSCLNEITLKKYEITSKKYKITDAASNNKKG